MADRKSVSDAELELLKELWIASPLTSRELIDRLRLRTDWGEPTVKTLLLRLLRKKAVRRELRGKTFVYAAAVGRDEYRCSVGRSLIDRLFDGEAGDLLSCLLRNGAVRPGELAELRRLLIEKKDADGKSQA